MTTQAITGRTRHPAKAFGALVKIEAKLAGRAPVGLVLGFALPVLLLVILGSVPALRKPIHPGSALTLLGQYIPVLIGLVLSMIALVSLPIPLALNRERGWLRRFSTTPVAPAWLLAAQVVVNLVMALMAIVVLVVGGAVFYHVRLPSSQAFGFLLTLVLVTAAMFAIGLLIAALAPTPQVAGVLGTAFLYPLLFFAGLWVPRQAMSHMLQRIGDFTPLGAAMRALQDAMQGSFPTARALLVLIAWAVIFGAAAVRYFRWE